MRNCPQCGRQCRSDARFCDACGALLEVESQPERRKPATLLFCDMSGSTSMGERVDAETVRRLMFRYFHEMRSAIERHGGTVEKFVGDAVMAVFGVPLAHEDDALRAVRAAAEMRDRLGILNEELERRFGTRILLRIGVNTGEVVAGDASSRETFVTGDAVNVAARLEQAAAPGEILLGQDTYRVVRQAVSAEPLEPRTAKGKSEPLTAYRLVEVAKAAPARSPDRPMVGRKDELQLLLSAFEEAASERRCRLVTAVGEPGVGKSRLAAALDAELVDRANVLRGRCLSYGEGITFWAVGEIVRQAAGILDEDSREEAREKIAALVAGEERSDLVADRVAQVIGLTDGQVGADEIAWAIRRLLAALARRMPLMLVVDDIQWAEEAFLELLASLPELMLDAPLLVLCLARPELLEQRPDWQATIRLKPLETHQADRLLEGLVDRGLDDALRDQVVRASGGNPLFVEELAAMLREGGVVAIPPTLDALLAERLDRLPAEERSALERGSVEGEVFHRGAVAELSTPEARLRLQSALSALASRELIRPEQATFVEDAAFRFKHLLVRDAAYRTLAKSLRAELHEAFANWLESVAGDRITEFEEIVGYHVEQASRYLAELGPVDEHGRALAVRASATLANAGRRALDRGDVRAATSLLERAAGLVPSDAPRAALLVDLGEALGWMGEREHARSVWTEAADAADAAGDTVHALRARLQIVELDYFEGSFPLQEELESFAQQFTSLGDQRGLGRTWFLLGVLAFAELSFSRAVDAFSRAIEHARLAGDDVKEHQALAWLIGQLGQGPTPVDEALLTARTAMAQAELGLVGEAAMGDVVAYLEAMRGNFDEARPMIARSIATFEELGQRNPTANSRSWASAIELLAGDADSAERHCRLAMEAHHDLGDRQAESADAAALARILLRLDRLEEAERVAKHCESLQPHNDDLAVARSVRARILARTGRSEAALDLARESVDLVEGTELLEVRADLKLALAEVLALSGQPGESTRSAKKALALYERKGHVPSAATARAFLAEVEQPEA